MYGLNPDLDLSFFHERRLDQVCVGEYDTRLNFDEDVSIGLQSEFTLDGQRNGPRDGHILHVLLALQVREARRAGRGDLVLDFGSHVLVVHDSYDRYESYTITNGADLTVV
jgi:hypothetical protein